MAGLRAATPSGHGWTNIESGTVLGGRSGPNNWNLGPPDGKIRADDILAVVYQYGDDCS